MFLFRLSRRPGPVVPAAGFSHANPESAVPGLDYYDAEVATPHQAPRTSLSAERAALDQAFGYWSET
jgi:hypothetical protein